MNHASKSLFARAVKLREDGQYKSAIALLEQLVDLEPDVAAVSGALGHCYWAIGSHVMACAAFRKAIELEPFSEAYSLGLFHCLWADEKHDEAFEEIKRFTKIAHSNDYSNIIAEINEKY